MAPKTQENDASVEEFLNTVGNKKRQADAFAVTEMMERITGWQPRMWGTSIIGFGRYHYTYESGRSGAWMVTGLSPRKQALTLYIMPGFSKYDGLMECLGKYKTGRSCLYINKLEDVDLKILEDLICLSVDYMKDKYQVG